MSLMQTENASSSALWAPDRIRSPKGWLVEPLEEGVALEEASHEQRGLGAHAEDDLVGLMLAAPRLPSPAHLLNPHQDAPGRVTAFRLAFVGADNYLRGVVT